MTYRRFKFSETANRPATVATLATVQENQLENRPTVATVATVASPLANPEARSVATVATVARVYRESTLSPADLEFRFEERAAILEYDEGLCREDAEALARLQIYGAEDRITVK